MKKLFIGLSFALCLFFSPVQAHDIPPEILQYLTENPDASQADFEDWLASQELGQNYEMWAEEETYESFSLPTPLIEFLLENPAANEPEILAFIQKTPALAEAGWTSAIEKLLAGETDPEIFTINDLALLDSLNQGLSQAAEPVPTSFSWPRFITNYVYLGITHILQGLDHILFVMVLVLLLPPWRRILALVTTFTIAHTVTLLLGGTQILALSSQAVEPLIAASIAYVAITSVFLRDYFPKLSSFKNQLLTVFLFGLFHGLGFAGVFAKVAPDSERLFPSLLFFNVGVEIGQLMILALWLPILYVIYKLKWDKYLIPIFAGLVSIFALSWLWERLFV